MRIELFEGIETVDRDLWQRVTQGHTYAGWRWCHYGEALNHCKGHYVVAFDADEPIGGAMFSIWHRENIPTSSKILEKLFSAYLNWRPLFICRTAPDTNFKGLFLPDDPDLCARMMDEIRPIAADLLRKHKGSYFLADYLLEVELDYAWGKFYRLNDFTFSGTRLDIEWADWDGFMAALRKRSKKQHKNVRNNTRYAQELGITIQFNEPPPRDVVLQLIKNKSENYEVTFIPDEITTKLDALPRLADHNYTWVTGYHEGKIIACEVLLYDDESGVCSIDLYGRDYDVPYVYFYMAYEDIRYAIEELRAKTIIYNTEAFEFKRRLGFADDPRNNLVFYPNSLIERSITGFLMRFMDR